MAHMEALRERILEIEEFTRHQPFGSMDALPSAHFKRELRGKLIYGPYLRAHSAPK